MKLPGIGGTTIERAEWRGAAAIAAIVVALSALPYLFGWFLRPADFMGHLYNADDPNVHLAWMRQAAEGHWLFTDRFTSEPQQPQFTHLLFLALGKLAGLAGGSYRALIVVYHLARLLCGWLLLVAVYVLAAYIYKDKQTRRLALWMVALSSGLGWLLTLLRGPGDYSCDYVSGPGLVMPEAITFLSLLIFPLFLASLLLIVALYLLLLRAFDTGRILPAIGAGVMGLLLGHIHSYDILPVYATIAGYLMALGISRRALPYREIGLAAVVVALSLPAPAYQYFVFQTNPIFQQKALTPTLSPSLDRYLLTYGLVALMAVVGALGLRRTPNRHGGLLVVWAVVTLAMTYAPVSFQRKMIEGVHIPLAILAAAGWAALGQRWRLRPALWLPLLVLLTVPSNVAFTGQCLRRLITNNLEGVQSLLPMYYLDADQRAALDWLATHGRPEDVVLGAPPDTCYLPPYSGVRTYVSHWAETIDPDRKRRELLTFLDAGTPDEWRQRFLREAQIRYVYHGPVERAIGTYDPAQAPFLRPVVSRETVALYEFVPDSAGGPLPEAGR